LPANPGGIAGLAFPGKPGNRAGPGTGVGGSVYRFSRGTVTIANTIVTGNTASTADNDVSIVDAVEKMNPA
jgi:hypothetical protein